MERLKKVIFIFLIPFFFAGCNPGKNQWVKENNKVKILSTTAQIGDLVTAIGGDRVDGLVLVRGELDPHSYEMVKGDLEKLDQAALIFYNGLGLEHGASISTYLHQSKKAIPIGEKIFASYPDQILKRGQVIDPHIWMDISLWQKGIEPIVGALCEIDPEGALLYQERAALLAQQMEAAHTQIRSLLQKIPSEKRFLVTSHDAFHYFTRGYLADPGETNWGERFAAPEGLAPEGQLRSSDIQKVIDFLKSKKVTVIFPESNVSRDAIRKIAIAGKELGLEIRICTTPLYGDSMGNQKYLGMMRHNAETLVKYLWTMQ